MTSIDVLEKTSNRVRKNIITMLHKAGSGHPGGSLSVTDILVALYDQIRIDPRNPKWEDRDRVILSKGHAAPALYAVLEEKEFFEAKEFDRLRKLGGKLQGHPDMNKTPGIDACTGSLGNGASIAVGIAMAGKLQKKDYRVYAILGDGELQEGIVWEAAAAAAHFRLNNLTIIIDYNGLQIDGSNDAVMALGNIRSRYEALGYRVLEVDGHDIGQLQKALPVQEQEAPVCIIARTVKGKGVSFMEDRVEWHGQAISKELYDAALRELGDKSYTPGGGYE